MKTRTRSTETRTALAALAAITVFSGAACRSKAPPPGTAATDPGAPTTSATPDPTAAPADNGAAPAERNVVLPKTVEELGQQIVEALVAKDLARVVAHLPARDFIDRNCPEQAPALRLSYAEKVGESKNGAEARAAECATLDWKDAKLARTRFRDGGGLPFYGCTAITGGALEVVVTVGEAERTVSVPTVYLANGGVFLGSVPRCPVPSPCPAIIDHLEALVAESKSAPELAPLPADKKGTIVTFCDSFFEDPAQREQLACMRSAKSYDGIERCGQKLSSLFVMWPLR